MLVFTFTKPLARGWFLTGPPQKKERQHKAIGPFTRYLKKILSVVYKHKEENRRVSDLFVKIPSKRDYPDYAAIVKNPIALKPMKNKILEGKYKSVKDFEQDMLLMADNAKLYNGADSFVYRDALKLLVSIIFYFYYA
ncbi:hypothetical protein Zmor_016400 [Zophobas morio]|uniref:Bromo domain-containing protein n=1 Tax=Zophobas morio TaxID=2755281 RepID=A0AA38HG28_9CUCU|nr:hypothetical protein Zmor_016400 [Zophobas morio]